MEYSERDIEQARFVHEPMTPEKVLGLTARPNLEEIESAYNERKQRLLNEVAAGQSGAGGRVIPRQESEESLAAIEAAYQTLKQKVEEEQKVIQETQAYLEEDTKELDPDFTKRMEQ